MTVGYLHLDPGEAGPTRFGRMIAGFVASHTPWGTRDVEAAVARRGVREAVAAARRLGAVDVAHVQYAPMLWGGRPWQIATAGAFRLSLRVPLVTTMHDIIPGIPPSTGIAARWLAGRSACVLVSTDTERRRVLELGVRAPVEVVGHFVEPRGPLMAADQARATLGLEGRRVVTLLGFIHPAKGHELAIEALGLLPDDTVLAFAGGSVPADDGYVQRLEARIRELGLDERVRITGYLPDDRLDTWLAASDVGILPFRDLAASGSLATWLATGRPLVATDVPVLREYAARAPSLIRLVPPGHPAALAEAIQATSSSPEARAEAAALADRFSPARTARRLAEIYDRCAGGRSGGGG